MERAPYKAFLGINGWYVATDDDDDGSGCCGYSGDGIGDEAKAEAETEAERLNAMTEDEWASNPPRPTYAKRGERMSEKIELNALLERARATGICRDRCLEWAAQFATTEEMCAQRTRSAAKWLTWLARYAIKGPWTQAEDAIASDLDYGLEYAVYVLQGAFPAAEPLFLRSASAASHYACHALRAPWPLGEAAIARDLYAAVRYRRDVLKGRPWPLGEAAIEAFEWAEYYRDGLP